MVDDLSRAGALVTRRLELLDHRAHLAECNLDTTAMADITRPDGALLATFATALGADNVASESELGGLAFIEILEGDVDAVDEIFALSLTSLPRTTSAVTEEASTAEELAEEIL